MREQDILEELLKNYSTVPQKGEASPQEETPVEEEAATADMQQTAPIPDLPLAEETVLYTAPMEQEIEELPVMETVEEKPLEDEATIAEESEDVTIAEETTAEQEPMEEEEPATPPMEFPTQVIKLEAEAEQEDDAAFDQMTMEDFGAEEVASEETAEQETDDVSWEQQLEETRREKIRDFQIQQNREDTDFRYAETQAPDEQMLPEPDEKKKPQKPTRFTGDYTDPAQRTDVAAEFAYRHRSLRFRMGVALVPVLLMLWSECTVLLYGQPTIAPTLFLLFNCGAFIAIGALLYPMLRDGATALLRLKPCADSVSTVVFVTTLIHTVSLWFQLSAVETGDARLLTAAAGVFLLLCGWGRMFKNRRIAENFEMVGADRQKVAAVMIDEERAAVDIGRRAVAVGIPRITYFRTVDFLDDFIANSYMQDRYDELLQRYMPIAAAFAAVIGIISGIVAGDFAAGLSAFAAAMCVVMPTASLGLGVPVWRECHRQRQNGNMLCGYAAAERFGNIHGLALDAADIYLHDSVSLHGIRTFGAARIDEVITDAAAVAIRTDGPLAGLFLRIIEEKTEILQPVENLVFEQDMGFSGWVGGRRVLVGNRKLLENHGVDTPSGDYERKYKKDGRELVYLSVAGELSAMFVISYVTDQAVADALADLQDAHVSLLFRSQDPNITEESICAGFRLDDFYVDLLPASAGRVYDRLRHAEETRVSAGAAVGGGIVEISRLLCGCKRLRRRGIAAMITQLSAGAVGGILAFALALSGGALTAGTALICVVLSAIITAVVSAF